MRGKQKQRWAQNVKEWTGMGFEDSLWSAKDRERWQSIVDTLSVVPRRPSLLRD